MPQSITTLNQLADIELPATPQLWLFISTGTIACLTIVLMYGLWRHRRRPALRPQKQRFDTAMQACKRIRMLAERWRQSTVNDRDAAYELATIVRLAWDMRCLPVHCPGWIKEQAHWQEIVDTLSQLRYMQTPPTHLKEVHFTWLMDWLGQAGKPASDGD